MAKIIEDTVTIKLSKLVGNNDNHENLVDENVIATLEEATKELVGDERIIVEVEYDFEPEEEDDEDN